MLRFLSMIAAQWHLHWASITFDKKCFPKYSLIFLILKIFFQESTFLKMMIAENFNFKGEQDTFIITL